MKTKNRQRLKYEGEIKSLRSEKDSLINSLAEIKSSVLENKMSYNEAIEIKKKHEDTALRISRILRSIKYREEQIEAL